MGYVSVPVMVEILLLLVVGSLVFGIAAACALPGELRRSSERCAFRRDGSLSVRRLKTERRLRFCFACDAMKLMVCSAMPVLLLGFLVFPAIMPVDFVDHLFDSRDELKEWFPRNRYSTDDARHVWPVALAALLLVGAGSLWFLLASLRQLAIRFDRALTLRYREYYDFDLGQEMGVVHRRRQPPNESASSERG